MLSSFAAVRAANGSIMRYWSMAEDAPIEPESTATEEGLPANYPVEWEADVVLRDGSVAHVRPITPSDTEGIHKFHSGQSDESIYLRFFAPIKRLSDKDAYRFTHVDYDQRAALVATIRGEIIGIARYDRLHDESTAEVAFNISDHFQGKGVGSVLLEHLAAIASDAGVRKFVADVLPQNRKMMSVFVDAGYEVRHHFDDGVIAVEFTIEPTEKAKAVQLAREHRAEAQSMSAVLTPSSVAVVGVSRRPDAIGSLVLDNLLDGGFTGSVHIVNTEADVVRGLTAHSKVSDIEGGVDMAIIAVPAAGVLDVVDDCAQAGVRTLVVVSSGFAEAGPEGEERQAELLRRARENGMRVLGPNSFGLLNNHEDVRLNATISRALPRPGTLGIFAQSGGLGVGLLSSLRRRGLGVSTFASAGNRVDVSGNDLMQYFIDDDATTAVGLYLESVGNARKFSRIARQLSLRKPVICVKTGTAGTVPPGHRARATRVDPAAFNSMLEQAGVIRARNIHELVDIAELITQQPLPVGNRLAVVGNSGGLNSIVVDAALKAGLAVTHGPVGLPIGVGVSDIVAAVEEAFCDPEVDSVLVCLIPPLGSSDEMVARALAHTVWRTNKPCLATFMGLRDVRTTMQQSGQPVGEQGQRHIVPVFETPLDGVTALAAVTRYVAWREREHGVTQRPEGVNRGVVRRIIERVLAEHPQGRDLSPEEAATLLAAYGIHVWPTIPAPTAEDAVAAAEQLGYPVVVKSMREGLRGRPGSGGVRGDLHTPASVQEAHRALVERLGADQDPQLVVQQMATPGIATLLRSVEDPLFGPVVSFGLSGPPADLLGDLAHRIPPLTDVDARDLVTAPAAAPLLHGYRGLPAVDREALEEIVLRVSQLADDHPEIAKLELDPLNAHPRGVDVLGVSIQLAPADARTDVGRRSLR
ncbi:bifunctional acetate--CoA ligase family protein/GNAT family N-acetyltransferase [Gephyromycinifex aptenodytis]|uniref:bifunctional acetate--CoA ligase family protein/GNAT family N-acetyltransferase n=1 Tax=Gephyromycinifex aptenodytis TaxID=2716227 RepID=UPI001D02EDCA|nr:GNAT family N-acetyltransferase [Gephyromycinifex aptenodytis]